ncbi:FecR family protein [Paraflavitalea sp. CAU 1676]|uniref:FecR family protein n=1 Tax=Paraflavitalea sp. CAU 1676 TaxID=3032598 RepID=UPI0023DADF08|nr:FecR family protein [Paraflavitalea sp. CAU 1676]MDF2189619.1 FecR domain-containing protein [Paraflavitalea sp. CAU 1676]
MTSEDHKMELIAKVLSGRASAAEQEQLQQWLADPAHREEYEELAIIWQESLRLTASQSFDKEAGWAKLAAKVNQSEIAQEDAGTITTITASSPTIVMQPLVDNEPMLQPDNRTIQSRDTSAIQRLKWPLAIAAAVMIAALLGWILWSRTTNGPWQETVAASNTSIRLSDGTMVRLRKGASLQYRDNFDGAERHVKLSGEAFFDVHHDEAHPFVITTGQAAIKVLGTSFLVNTSDRKDEVIVVTGRVRIASISNTGNRVEIGAGQRALLQQEEFVQTPVTDSNFIAWNTGLIEFRDKPLEQALEDLSNLYVIPIELDTHNIVPDSLVITARFNNLSLEQALGEVALITGLSMKKENSKILFYMK